ncbi:MAG: hypothetical protein Q9198_003376 [Flavoplaca austrocitrina]
MDNRRPVGNARSTHTNILPEPNQDTASALTRGMQTNLVPKFSQQTPRNACLPSQQIQVPPPTSTSRLAPNLDARGLGYLPAYQLGRPHGKPVPPLWCWPRDPDAKLYDDVAGADKLEMNRNRRIQGQKRFLPQRGELDIKTWDVRNKFYEYKGSIVDLVEFDNQDLRWVILDDNQTVVGYPTEVNLDGRLWILDDQILIVDQHQHNLIAKFRDRPCIIRIKSASAASPSRPTTATTSRNDASQTYAEGKPPSTLLSEKRGSRTLETPSDLQMIPTDEDDYSPSRPAKRSLLSKSYRAGTPFPIAADLKSAPQQPRPASEARDAGKFPGQQHHTDRGDTRHDDGIEWNEGNHHAMMPLYQPEPLVLESLRHKQRGRERRVGIDLEHPSQGNQTAMAPVQPSPTHTTIPPGASRSSLQREKTGTDLHAPVSNAVRLRDLDQSIQAAHQPLQPPLKRTSKPRLPRQLLQQLSQYPPQHLSQYSPQHLSQCPPQHSPMKRQQQPKQQPYRGIYTSVSANIEERPGQPQPMLPATNLEPLQQLDIPSKNHKEQRITNIKDLLRDHDEDSAEFQSQILGCTGAREAESYHRRMRNSKHAQERFRRELRALEEDVSLYGLFLILARRGILLT